MLEKQYDHESIQEYRTNIKRLMKYIQNKCLLI